jgi:hypothetical protein
LANKINYLALYEYSYVIEDLKIASAEQHNKQEELESKLFSYENKLQKLEELIE